ncbi:TPA: IS607 family transposase, partial [Candidatus Bipolaricaulota bacterium]|nr:IS607 family transposase [Candidatus Bipolaricaulota bacterium]
MDRMGKLYYAAEAARMLGVTPQTLRLWVRQGKIKALKTPGGRYRYPLSEIRRLRGDITIDRKRAILYARVSSTDQKSDLEEQLNFLKKKASEMGLEVVKVLKDTASGLDESRRGYLKVLDSVIKGEADVILITYQDRLTRFGF